MEVKDIVPSGSITKCITAVGIMKLYEEGILNLNDTIDVHVNKILQASNHSTIQDIWDGDARINSVTIYELLHMKGGLKDYDDAQM